MRIAIDRFQVRTADAGRFTDAFLRLFNDRDSLAYLSFTGLPFTETMVQSWLRQASGLPVEYYLAMDEESEGQIVGILALRADRITGFEVIGVAVDVRYRGNGIGSRLVETAVRRAEERGFAAVEMAVYADNKDMLALAIRHGFKPARIDYHKRFDGEDIVYLKKYGPKNKYTMT